MHTPLATQVPASAPICLPHRLSIGLRQRDRLPTAGAIESAQPTRQSCGLRYCTTASRKIAESWAFGSLASFLRTISSANRR